VQLGILVPGRRCDLCNAMLMFHAFATPLGGVFCTSHGDLPNCLLCSAPLPGGGRYCGPCAATSIYTRDHVRRALPPVRELLHDMGVRLTPPVHVQLVDGTKMRTLHARESGTVLGVTLVQGRQVTEVCIAAGLPAIEFGSTVAHECMHAWLAQNGFGQIDPSIEEGLCEVVSYRYLRDQPDPRAPLLRLKLDRNPDPVYGDGFRAAKASVKRHGMNPVLAAVKHTGRLP
jgi:hypothetical protein